MAKKTKLSNRVLTAKRKRIHKMFHEKELTIPQIMEEENVSYWQVYRIITGQTKIDGSPRTDKGKSRTSMNEAGELVEAKWSLEDFKDLEDFQMFILMSALEDAATTKMEPADKVKLVKDIEVIQTKVAARQLKNNLRRPDAEVIARIIRRFQPNATDKDIISIYKEEAELYLRERKND